MSQEGLLSGNIEPVELEDELQRSYLDYAMSVIVGRALPEVRDGLKPVHRRILWTMYEQGIRPDRPHRKSANVVGGVMAKYHPHGNAPIYDALVRMAQDFSLRRLLIDLKRGANPQVVLNQLYKHTQLQESFGAIMLALVDGVPRTLTLAELIGYYVDHQIDVVTRRTRFELRKAEERDHIVQGLLIALDPLDEVIRIIRGSQDAEQARSKLMAKFKLSEIQANHILDMPLRRLTKLARAELEQEHKELLARIRYLKGLLKDPAKIRGVIKEELLEIREKHADPRRTQIKADEGSFDVEDLIAEEDVVITV